MNLNNNLLSGLPLEFGRLTRMANWSVMENQFSEIPKCLEHLFCMKRLHIGSNVISEVPNWIGVRSLMVELSLHKNVLKTRGLKSWTTFGFL